MSDSTYVGNELALFAKAKRWKAYVYSALRRQLGDRVLEVGAGIGKTTTAFCRGRHKEWVCLEPDSDQVCRISALIDAGILPDFCRAARGTIDQLPESQRFDSILYIDVLEHIEDDATEVRRARDRLEPGGHLIVVSPAHQWLFTPFDEAIGHWRRYTKASLESVVPEGLIRVRLAYLDSIGLLASIANLLVLRQAMPTSRQISTWDTLMVPASRLIDPITFHRIGKSVIGIWRKA